MIPTDAWFPAKPVSEATDEEIIQSPIGQNIQKALKESEVGKAVTLEIARNAWHDAFNLVNDYPHLSEEQRAEIREVAIRIFAAGNGGDVAPGEEVAREKFGDASITECLQQMPPDDRFALSFDPRTGEAWKGEAWDADDDEEGDEEVDDDVDDDDDDGYEKDYTVSIEVPITLRIPVSAFNPNHAKRVAREFATKLRFKSYVHSYDGKSAAEMIGLEERGGKPCKEVRFDTPELLDTSEMEVEEG